MTKKENVKNILNNSPSSPEHAHLTNDGIDHNFDQFYCVSFLHDYWNRVIMSSGIETIFDWKAEIFFTTLFNRTPKFSRIKRKLSIHKYAPIRSTIVGSVNWQQTIKMTSLLQMMIAAYRKSIKHGSRYVCRPLNFLTKTTSHRI